MMDASSYTENNSSSYSDSDGSYTPHNHLQEIAVSPSAIEEPSTFTDWAVGAGIVLLHDLRLELELVRQTFSVQLPEWLLQKVRNPEVAERTQEAVLGTLAHAASPDGELILAGDIDEALWNVISDSVNGSLPPIRRSDAPLLEELLRSVEPIDLVLMPDEMSETLRKAFAFILSSCHTLKELKVSLFNTRDEYAWKRPVDNLVELAFVGGGGNNNVLLEIVHNADLAIPYSTSNYPPLSSEHESVSDTCILTPRLYFSPVALLAPLDVRFDISALWEPFVNHLHILQFVVEYEQFHDATSWTQDSREPKHVKRLIAHLGSAQYQRRSLGFSDHSIYGIAVSKGHVKAYVAWWEVVAGDNEDQSRIYVHEVATFNLFQPLGTLRFFIFLLLVKQDIEVTYNADLWHMTLQDVDRVEHQWSPSLKGWRRIKRDGDAPHTRDSAEYSGRNTDSVEGDCGCGDSNEEEGMGDGESEGHTDEFEDYRDEAFLDQPMEGSEDGDDDGDAPFIRHITGLVIQTGFPDRMDRYRRVVVGDSAFTSIMSVPIPIYPIQDDGEGEDEDEEDEEDEEVESPIRYAFLASPPLYSSPLSSTPRPRLTYNNTSDPMMSNLHTWTAWEKESLGYDDDRAEFIHEAFCDRGDDEDMNIKIEGGEETLDSVRSLSALD